MLLGGPCLGLGGREVRLVRLGHGDGGHLLALLADLGVPEGFVESHL